MKTKNNYQQHSATLGGTAAGHAPKMMPVSNSTFASGGSRPVRQRKNYDPGNPWGLSEVRVDAIARTGKKSVRNMDRKSFRQGNSFSGKGKSAKPGLPFRCNSRKS